MPLSLRVAIGLLCAQFLALFGLFAIFVILVIREPSVLGAYVAIFAAIFTAALFGFIVGLTRRKTGARGGVIALELLALAPVYYMLTGGQKLMGSIIGASIAAVIILLMAPQTSKALI